MADIAKNVLVEAPTVGNSRQPEPVVSADVRARIARSVAESKSPSTVRAYASDWRRFDTWCARRGHQELPANPLVVAAYLTDAADTLTDTGTRGVCAGNALKVDRRDRTPAPSSRIPATDNGSDRHRDPVRDPPKLCRGR